jgi:hypothetical protein
MAARKTNQAGSATAAKKKKKTAPKPAAAAKKKTARKPAAAAKKKTGASAEPEAKKAEPKKKSAGFTAEQVNLAQVFALRPRVVTSFKPADFKEAKRRLEGESWKTAEEAARAVAERALNLEHETGSKKRGARRGRS